MLTLDMILHRWVGIRVDFMGTIFSTSLAAYLTYGGHLSASNTGFSLAMASESSRTFV